MKFFNIKVIFLVVSLGLLNNVFGFTGQLKFLNNKKYTSAELEVLEDNMNNHKITFLDANKSTTIPISAKQQVKINLLDKAGGKVIDTVYLTGSKISGTHTITIDKDARKPQGFLEVK